MSTRFLPFFVSVIFLISCSVSQKTTRTCTRILLQDSTIKNAQVGVSIYEPASNKYWYQYNSNKNFIPASTTKLFTLYVAMKYLGDSLTGINYFEDNNKLFVFPTGDPTFLHSDFVNQPVFNFLEKNKDKEIIVIEPTHQTKKYGKGWAWDDANEAYMPERNAMPMYGNTLQINWNKKRNELVSTPPSTAFSVTMKLDTALQQSYCEGENNHFVFNNNQRNDFSQEIPFETNGITTTINLLKSNLNCNIHSGTIENYNNKKLISIASQPRDSVLKKMMSRSDNFYAEQLLLMASNQLLGYMSDDKMIDTLLKKDFSDMPQQPRWVDGSGLSRYNLFSPNDFIYVIKKIINEFGLSTLKNMLPTGGTGTLKNMLVVDSGFVFAKTGSFSNNYNISGLLVTKKNKPLLFSIMVNHYIGNSKALRKKIEIFIHQIRENN